MVNYKFARIRNAIAVLRLSRTNNASPEDVAAAAADLELLVSEASVLDKQISDTEKVPDGNDYNELFSIINH